MKFEYETPRLILKLLKPDKADQVLDFYLRDQALFEQFEPDRMTNFYTRQFQKQALTYEYNMAVKGNMLRYYVYEKEQPDRIIGTISIQHITRGYFSSCEIGYKFSAAVHHRGYATEALMLVTNRIFCDLKLHRIMAWVLPDNDASIRLLERVGFRREGICHGYLYLHGKWWDHAQYSLLASDQPSERAHIQ
jgi:ribosomal-protein-alanine N-acetyltransferase